MEVQYIIIVKWKGLFVVHLPGESGSIIEVNCEVALAAFHYANINTSNVYTAKLVVHFPQCSGSHYNHCT